MDMNWKLNLKVVYFREIKQFSMALNFRSKIRTPDLLLLIIHKINNNK